MEFEREVRVNGKEEISTFIRETMLQGREKLAEAQPTTRRGIDVLYQITEQIHLRVFIGRFGFITTAFPIPNKLIQWTIMRHQARIFTGQTESERAQRALLRFNYIQLRDGGDDKHYGLVNIHRHHGDEFKKLSEKIDCQQAISKFIRETMERNHPAAEYIRHVRKGKLGIIAIYPALRDNYLVVLIGQEGGILTAYPLLGQCIEWALKIIIEAPSHLLSKRLIILSKGSDEYGLGIIYKIS